MIHRALALFIIASSLVVGWRNTLGLASGEAAGQAKIMRTVVSKDGTRIASERSGKGPALVLVAGALSGRSGGSRLAALLAEHYTVINYDRRGRGESGDTQPYAVQREVEDIEALIDDAGGRAFVFGASSGAVLALEASARLRQKVTKAALFEPPFVVDDSRPRVPPDFVDQANRMVSADRRGDAVAYFLTNGVGLPVEAVAGMRRSPMWPGMEKLAHTLAYDGMVMGDTQAGKALPAKRWAPATVPVLVIDGGKSPAWLRNAARGLTDVLADARLHTIDGVDHSAPMTSPQALVPVLVEFYDGGRRANGAN